MTAPAPHPTGQAAQPRNGLGVAGFVLGLLAALFSLIPIIGVIAWPLAILGLIFGILGVLRARKGVATNKGLAIAGTVLSAIGLVICIAWVAALGSQADEIQREADRIEQELNQGMPAEQQGGSAGASAPAEQSSAKTDVVYEVLGDGTAGNVTYTSDGMATTEQQSNVTLPFRKELSLDKAAFQMFSITAQNGGSGELTCRITVDGDVIKEATSSGQYSVVSCNGSR